MGGGENQRSVALTKASRTSRSLLRLGSLLEFLHVVTTLDGIEKS